MKRIISVFIFLLFSGFLFTSCLEDCANCRSVTYDADGDVISEGTEKEYCDAELDDIESQEPVVIGDNTTKWECD